MSPRTRRGASPKFVIERDEDSEESSSDEDEENGVGGCEDNEVEEEEIEEEEIEETKRREKKPITISLKKVCKVSFSIWLILLGFYDFVEILNTFWGLLIFSSSVIGLNRYARRQDIKRGFKELLILIAQ